MENVHFKERKPKSLEELKRLFSNHLNNILHSELTVENIQSFGTVAMNGMINLVQDIKKEMYQIEKSTLHLSEKDKEDYFFKKLDLDNIPEVLDLVAKKEEQIKRLQEELDKNTEIIDIKITPPDKLGTNFTGMGENRLEEKEKIPRLLTLMYILNNDFDLDPSNTEEVIKKRGIVTVEMVRETPYDRTEIPSLNRVVYTCDEEGNVSFIFDTTELKKHNISIEDLDDLSKKEKENLIAKKSKIGKKMKQSKNWRFLMSESLKEISEKKEEDIVIPQSSEFEKKLSKEKLEIEIIDAYIKEVLRRIEQGEKKIINIEIWYTKEQTNHQNWYKSVTGLANNGIILTELLERETPIEHMKEEIIWAYQQAVKNGKEITNLEEWYQEEQNKHPNWNKNYYAIGKMKELIRKEKIILSKEELENEIIDAYIKEVLRRIDQGEDKIVNIETWYKGEEKRHSNWPSSSVLYKKEINLTKLLERETPIEHMKEEIIWAYQQAVKNGKEISNLGKWYIEEQNKHPNWLCYSTFRKKLTKKEGIKLAELLGRKK